MSKNGKAKRLARQVELLKNFEGDFYQEKKVGDGWYVKSFNGGTKRWQVSIYSQESFNKYSAFKKVKRDEEELENSFKENIA